MSITLSNWHPTDQEIGQSFESFEIARNSSESDNSKINVVYNSQCYFYKEPFTTTSLEVSDFYFVVH